MRAIQGALRVINTHLMDIVCSSKGGVFSGGAPRDRTVLRTAASPKQTTVVRPKQARLQN